MPRRCVSDNMRASLNLPVVDLIGAASRLVCYERGDTMAPENLPWQVGCPHLCRHTGRLDDPLHYDNDLKVLREQRLRTHPPQRTVFRDLVNDLQAKQ